MKLDAGQLRHRITYQQMVPGENADGSPQNVWTDVATIWAAIDPLSLTGMSGAREFLAANNVAASQDMVRVLHRPRLVRTDWRFLYRGRVYDVQAAREDNFGESMQVYATVGDAVETADVVIDGGNAASPGPGSISGGGA